MQYRLLGGSGLKVSELCLGAMYFGGASDEETSFRILDEFADRGGSFIDTASSYTEGRSEAVLGRWLTRHDRDDFVIATKLMGRWTDGPANTGLSRKNIVSSVDASLSRLGTDYVDLYYTHAWDETTPIAETLSTLNDLVTAGKIRYIGASNLAGWQLQKSLDLSDRNGWARYIAGQAVPVQPAGVHGSGARLSERTGFRLGAPWSRKRPSMADRRGGQPRQPRVRPSRPRRVDATPVAGGPGGRPWPSFRRPLFFEGTQWRANRCAGRSSASCASLLGRGQQAVPGEGAGGGFGERAKVVDDGRVAELVQQPNAAQPAVVEQWQQDAGAFGDRR
jgi:hypothetical protein